MNRQKHKISWFIATWFGSGLLPKAPGTWGSLAAIPFAYLFSIYTCPYAQLFGITVLFFIGIWASDKIEESAQIKDPGFIVVDEVVGQWMALLPLPFLYTIIDTNSFYLYSVPIAVAGFLAFRLFDIWKPWPVNYADKNIPGGYGIMFDDVIAGMYALVVTSVLTAVMVMICL
jgi:phosphatidylglycerophosphatase A